MPQHSDATSGHITTGAHSVTSVCATSSPSVRHGRDHDRTDSAACLMAAVRFSTPLTRAKTSRR